MILSYPDASTFITAWRTRDEPESKALAYLYDPSRTLVASRFVVLETLTKAAYQRRRDEVSFYEETLGLVREWIPNDDALLERAIVLASTYDIMNLDALHIASAERVGVQEFVTTEKPGKPLYRATHVGPVFLGDL